MDIHKLADHYVVAIDEYNSEFRNVVLNQPVMDGAISFKTTADMVIEHLNKIDPEGSNPQIKSTIHTLMDIINNFNVPNIQQILSASNSAYSLISTTAPTNKDAITTSKYLANLAKIIAYKYYRNNEEEQGQQNEQMQRNVVVFNKREPLWKFLDRIYKTLRSGQAIQPVDTNRWNSEKATLTSRLTALTQMKTRTPAQEQEKNVIAFIQSKLH